MMKSHQTVRDHSTAMPCVMQKYNWLNYKIGCHILKNRQRKI